MAFEGKRISVVIPFFNADKFIENAFLQLERQTWKDFEVIVVDDGSTDTDFDRISKICEARGATFLRQANGGPGSARNLGANSAKGEWIAFLDVDDQWEPCKLEKQLAAAEGYQIILCDALTVDGAGELIRRNIVSNFNSSREFLQQILIGNVFSFTSTIFISAAAFQALGGFNTRLRFWEDHELLYRSIKTLRWTCVPEPLSRRVIHEASMSHVTRNLDTKSNMQERVKFFDAICKFDSEVDPNRYLVRQMHSNIKKEIVLGKYADASSLALRAAYIQPSRMKTYCFLAAILASMVKPSMFDHWYPELVRFRIQRNTGLLKT